MAEPVLLVPVLESSLLNGVGIRGAEAAAGGDGRAGMGAPLVEHAGHLTGPDEKLPLVWDHWKEQGGVKGRAEMLKSREELLDQRLLRRCTYTGRPFGEEEFVRELEQRIQRTRRR